VTDDPLPHYTLSRDLERTWREQRRGLLGEHGITVRRAPRTWPADLLPEPLPTSEEWIEAILDVAVIQAGGAGRVVLDELSGLVDEYLLVFPDDRAMLLERLATRLAQRLKDDV
jgi:hypothetical protein